MSNDEDKEKIVEKELLGSVKKFIPTGGHVVDPKKISAPLKKGGIVRFFCKGCGSLRELSEKGAKKLSELAEVDISQINFEKIYFEVERCIACDEEFKGVKIKNIVLVH